MQLKKVASCAILALATGEKDSAKAFHVALPPLNETLALLGASVAAAILSSTPPPMAA